MTFGGPGIEPTTSRFQVRGPTHWGILASQNCSSGGFLCIKNTKSVCQISRMRTCALFFPCQNSARPSFSAAQIARPGFFRSQNSPPRVFPQPYTEFLHIVSSKLGRIYLPRMRRAGLACRLAWNFPAGRANMAGLVLIHD